MDNWHLLIVEDDPDGQDLMQRIMHYHQIKIDVAPSAEDALQRLAQTNYTAAIVDLSLPKMDGWTLLKTIHQTSALPCIAMTAYHSPELAVKAVEAGFVAYFPKPLEAASFLKALQRVLS